MTARRVRTTGQNGAGKIRFTLIALLGSTALMMPSPARAEFRDLGYATPGSIWNYSSGISGNGRYFVGQGQPANSAGAEYSFIYDAQTGAMQRIQQADISKRAFAYDVSNDGVVVGDSYFGATNVRNAFRWTLDGGFETLGTFDGTDATSASLANAISDDGKRVVGWSTSEDAPWLRRAFLWVEGATTGVADNRQMYVLSSIQPSGQGMANSISANGLFSAGMSTAAGGNYHATRWDMRDLTSSNISAVQDLGTLGGSQSNAYGISADGRVVVGFSQHAGPYGVHAFRWEEGGTAGSASNPQMEDLGTLGGESSEAYATTADGRVVVGRSDDDDTFDERAFRWTRETGMIKVSDWLAQNGVNVGDAELNEATGVSNSGSVIIGNMRDPDNEGIITPFIARVAVPGEGGSGLMNVNEYNATAYDAGYTGWAAGNAFKVPLNGAHHRVLMDFPTQPSGICGWTNGDLAHYDDGRDTGVALAEAGLCGDLADGTVRIGLGGGLMHSTQDLMNDGSAELDGRYLVGELDWQPDGLPVIFSLTGLYGGSDAEIRRAYSNGATMAYSEGETDLVSGTLRLRADWKDAFRLGTTSFSPYVSYAVSRTTVDGYTETGGSFPATFDEQVVDSGEVRLGLASRTELTSAVALRGTLELVHGAGDAPLASGQVIGLHGFSFGGGSYSETWVRAGADLDVKVTESALLSLSMHAATEGLDAQISGAARLQVLF